MIISTDLKTGEGRQRIPLPELRSKGALVAVNEYLMPVYCVVHSRFMKWEAYSYHAFIVAL